MSFAPDRYALVADTGGTNTRVALADGATLLPDTVTRYANADYPDLESVLRAFIAQQDNVDCAAAAIAVAGPVMDGRAELTNLDWTIDEETVARATRAERVAVLNDLAAQGHAMGHIAPGMLHPVLDGPQKPGAAQLVIGVGTGFNIAAVHPGPGGRIVPAAEAGHVTLPVRNEADLRLALHLQKLHGFASVEDLLSGRGLERLYAWQCDEAGAPHQARAAEIMAALKEGEARAEAAARSFAAFLGTVAGDQALIHLPFGGLYLIGGVARALAPHLPRLGFGEAFRDKGRFADLMDSFRVTVVEDDYAALHGLAHFLAA